MMTRNVLFAMLNIPRAHSRLTIKPLILFDFHECILIHPEKR